MGDEIKINIEGVLADTIGEEHGLSKNDLSSVDQRLEAIAKEMEETLEDEQLRKASMMGWLTLGEDKKEDLATIQAYADEIANTYQYLLVIGIGGSSLGAKALLHALQYLGPKLGRPEIVFLENADPETLTRFENALPKTSDKRADYKGVAINVISKSGTTAETSANFEVVIKHMKECGLDEKAIASRIIATTDKHKGRLREIAQAMNLRTFEVPDGVGGRFSVFSDVGLFPLAVAGVNISRLLEGVRRSLRRARNDFKNTENHAYQLAKIFYLMDHMKGKDLHGLFLYGDAFREIGAWFEQLWAESLGKRDDVGPRPLAMIGSTAQHSVNQDNIAGKPNKVILFISTNKSRIDYTMPGESVDYLKGNSIHGLLLASMRGTQEALRKRGRPYIELMLPQVEEETIAEFLFTLEVATYVAGRLYGVDPFNQPAVEEAKIGAREALRKAQEAHFKV